MKLFSKFIFSALCLVNIWGCSVTSFRAPVCAADAFEFPDAFLGWYQLTLPQENAQYSGMNSFAEVLIKIERHDNGGIYALISPSTLGKIKSLNDLSLDYNFDLGLSNVCKVGPHYYSQSREKSNTYSLTRVHFSATGINFLNVAMDPEEMQKMKVPVYYVPKVEFEEGKGFSPDMMDKLSMYVDNRGVDSVQLLEKAHTVSFGHTLTRAYRQPMLQDATKDWVSVRLDKRSME